MRVTKTLLRIRTVLAVCMRTCMFTKVSRKCISGEHFWQCRVFVPIRPLVKAANIKDPPEAPFASAVIRWPSC